MGSMAWAQSRPSQHQLEPQRTVQTCETPRTARVDTRRAIRASHHTKVHFIHHRVPTHFARPRVIELEGVRRNRALRTHR